jgi:dTDP-4-amino-4,6-dideoxygalactose transaminase
LIKPDDLAIFSGQPAFAAELHVGRPNLGDEERFLERLKAILNRRWLTNDGPYVGEFERKLAEIIGVKHCVATCNATAALEMTIRALGLSGECIVPSFTFVSTPHALEWQGIKPVFGDVDQSTHNLDPSSVEGQLTPSTTGIIGVHVWGRACDISSLEQIARRRKLRLIFDAAHAFGCSCKGCMIGNFGDAEIFSFHATKFVNSFEGGAIATNDDELAAKTRLMRNFGFAGMDRVILVGINAKMSEVSAAMGLTSLESMNEFIRVNRYNYRQYCQELASVPGITIVKYDEKEKCNYQYITLEIDEAETKVSRDEIQSILWAENVLARRYFYPGCHNMEPYRSRKREGSLAQTERLAKRVLNLPTGTSVDAATIGAICDIIKTTVEFGGEISSRLKSTSRIRSV